jgi:SNF2 family DNA or RNA helicase
MLKNKRGYNFSGLGSGKTASSLWFCDILLEQQKIKKVLIICPLSIMISVWGKEITQTIPNRSYSIVHGTRGDRIKALERKAHFYITNHDAVRTYSELLMKQGFDVIIIDEIDAFKNPSSKRSKHMAMMAKKARAIYGLTGTPMANSPMEAFGIAKVINPDMLPTRYKTRWQQLTMYQLAPFIWEPNPHASEICHAALQPAIMFRTEDCIDLPDITYTYTEFKMTISQAKLYKEMMNDQITQYKEGVIVASTAAVKFTKLLQIASGCIYDMEGNTIVLPMDDKIKEISHIVEQTGSVIIFCQFISVVKELNKLLPSSKAIYGEVSQSQRAKTLQEFEDGKFKVLIAQPRVAAHGLNLQFCSTIIFYGPILGNSYYRQAVGRIRRSGQLNKQLVINFFSSKVEKKLYEMLETKEVSSQELLDMYTS